MEIIGNKLEPNQILIGHVLDKLKMLPNESVHMVCTSPPYWGLRDYGFPPQVWDEGEYLMLDGMTYKAAKAEQKACEHEWQPSLEPGGQGNGNSFRRDKKAGRKRGGHQPGFCQKCNAWRGSLGLEPDPDLYIQHIVQVFREIWRVLRKDGTVWLNISDTYSGSGGSAGHTPETKNLGRKTFEYGAYPSMAMKKQQNLPAKNLCMIPARVALALQAAGWWLRRDIIWEKLNPMPESCTDRPTSSHEYLFLLTKSGTSKFWTHRDRSGTRARPKADYRWVNQITDEEVDVAPPDWKNKIICPNCDGKGMAMIDMSCEILGQWMENWVEDECPVCEGKKKIRKWKRINLWRGHDYFYDQEAVREKYDRPLNRWGGPALKEETEKHSKYLDMQNIAETSILRAGRHHRPDAAGRNLRSVWQIPTRSFPEAHFAVFPEALVTIPIKAGTSEKGCCPKCGAAWTRVVEKGLTAHDGKTESQYQKGSSANRLALLRQSARERGGEYSNESKTIGWRPTCNCPGLDGDHPGSDCVDKDNWPVIHCIVLDPFMGSGTTAVVARRLGQDYLGIDLGYSEIQEKRLKKNEDRNYRFDFT